MTVLPLYFVLSALQLMHGTEEYLTGWSERSPKLYAWYRRFLPFVSEGGMSTRFHVLLNFTLGWIFLLVAIPLVDGHAWAVTLARVIAGFQILHAFGVHILAWVLFPPYFPGAITAVLIAIVAVALLVAN